MYSPSAGVEFNRLVSSGLQILDSRGCLCPHEEELPSWASPNHTLPAWLVLSSCQPVLLLLQNRKTKGKFVFLTPRLQPAAVMKDSLLACLLPLRFIFRACCIQATYFLTHTHIHAGLRVCRTHRYDWWEDANLTRHSSVLKVEYQQ